MSATSIQWTERVWNPLRGCSRISPGCEHCYAEGIAVRFSGPGLPFEGYATRGKGWTRKVSLLTDKLIEPMRWKTPSTIFVNSMSDLFHEAVPFEDIAAIFGVMAACPQHTFQVLTKRADRMLEFFAWVAQLGCDPWTEVHAAALSLEDGDGDVHTRSPQASGRPWPLPNVHLGVSIENQRYAELRIALLLRCPAAVRWVSAEPLLGPLNLRQIAVVDGRYTHVEVYVDALHGTEWRAATGRNHPTAHADAGAPERCPRLDWVVCGGESGRGARPFDLGWARAIRDDCAAAGVPFFMKQLGAAPFDQLVMHEGRPVGGVRLLLKDKHGGSMTEWDADLRVRQWPASVATSSGGAP